jgi:2-polyprenyl-3-methyl-5-hydroxy-6-metoxy-1,4-benzoquinol methylase
MTEPCVDIELEYVSCLLCGASNTRPLAQGFDYEYWTSDQEFHFVECQGCGHVFLNPRPTIAASERIYPSNYYTLEGRHTRESSPLVALAKSAVVRRRLALFQPLLKSGCSILEVGCGDCNMLLDLKSIYPATRITGVDLRFSQAAQELCTRRGITLVQGAIEDIPIPPETFDLVIMNQLIEHLWDPRLVIQKIFAALKPNGFISIETVNLLGYDRRWFEDTFWGGYYFPRHLNLFSFSSLARLLEETGFKVVAQYSLLAPVIWTYSLHGYLSGQGRNRKSLLAGFFTDRNPLCLAAFSLLDLLAIYFGVVSSNQKTMAQKVVI